MTNRHHTSNNRSKHQQNNKNNKHAAVDFSGGIQKVYQQDIQDDDNNKTSSSSCDASGCTDKTSYSTSRRGGRRIDGDDDDDVESQLSQSSAQSQRMIVEEKEEEVKDEEEENSNTSTNHEPTVTVVTDLDVYMGDTLEDRIDSFIAAHPVVMFNKTWCLFSIDAQNFLTDQMGVSLHSIELDVHPDGKAISRYIKKKTRHDTVPIIYIKGEFLGGFEDVNALYAAGKLQDQYLQNLTQADRCEEYIKNAKIKTQPLFWFPETVNAYVVRAMGIMTSLSAALCAIVVHWFVWGRYIAYGVFLDFVLRLFGGAPVSVMGRVAMLLTSAIEPKPRHGRPKQFATMCGVMFSGMGSLAFMIPFPYHDFVGIAFMGGLAIASGMEGFLDFCVGCVIFKYGIKLGLIPK